MGRRATGAITVNSTHRIEMKNLIQRGYLIRNQTVVKSMEWTSGSSVVIKTVSNPEECFIQLNYNLTNIQGEKFLLDYKIMIEEVTSNLGKGSVFYFICPFTEKKCKILYLAYGSHYFKSREAYSQRLYYDNQMASKTYRTLHKYFGAEAKLEDYYKAKGRRNQITFRGKPTKNKLKMLALERRLEMLNYFMLIEMRTFLKKGREKQ